MPNVLYALGDPSHLKIVAQLATAREELCCQDIFVGEGVAKSTQSHYFKILREAGLIRMVPQGRRLLLSLRREDLEMRFPGLLDAILHTYRQQIPETP